MKKQYTLSATVLSVVFLMACSKSFITIPPVSNQTTATFFKSTSDFQQAVNAVYDGLLEAFTFQRYG